MFGYLIWHGEGKPRAILERRTVCGVRFLTLEVRGGVRRMSRRVRRGIQTMAEHGVRRWVAAPGWPEAWRADIAELDEQELRRALLPQLLEYLAGQGLRLDCAAVELTAPWADDAVYRAACLLIRRCRYLRLRMPGAAELGAALWREYGVVSGGTGDAALEVCFGRPVSGAPALLLGPDCGRLQRAAYSLPAPVEAQLGDCPLTGQLTAALWMAGAVKTKEIRLKSLDFSA